MGKANRIKSGKDFNISAKSKRNKKNSSLWYTLALSLVAVFVASVIIISAVVSSGVLMRNTKAIYTEDYTINGNMLKYMFMSEYREFENTYSYYYTTIGLNANLPLADQEFSDTAESLLQVTFDGSWHDYFMSSVKSRVEQILLYCEVAEDRGIILDDDDNAAIDEAVHSFEHTAEDLGYSVDQYITLYFGEGISLDDIRDVFELETLATKVAEIIDAEIMDGITKEEINSKYEADKKAYNVKDYIYYYMTVEYDAVVLELYPDYDGKTELTEEQEAAVLELYKTKINEAKEKAETFASYESVDAFKDAVREDVANTAFDSYYKSEALADADKLSETDLETVKAAMIAAALEAIKNGEEMADATSEADGVYTAYGVTLTGENAAKAIDSVKTKLFSSLESSEEDLFSQKVKYDSTNEIPKWAFDEAEGVGATKTKAYGDGSGDGEIEVTNKYYDVVVYMLASDEYCDKTNAKHVGYMTFATEAAAKAAIESFKTSASKDYAAWESVAKSCSAATVGKFENYLEGQLSYGTYETWLYDEATVVGTVTDAPITNSSTTASEYAIFLYYGEGDEAWYIDVKNAIFVEDYQDFYQEISEKYPITIDDEVLAKIDINN